MVSGADWAGSADRPIDVICAGMYRACSTWQYEVVAQLVEAHRGGRRLGYLTPQEYLDETTPATTWRIFKSHDRHRCFASAIARDRAVVIYAYRDIRDVVFSLMHKRQWSFEAVLGRGMIHQVLANDRFWTRQPHVIIQRYDDILADPVGSIRALARHLGIDPGVGEAERLAEEYSLAANKARTEALRKQLEQRGVDLNQSSNAWICDASTLLHWNHVRDGRPGSWESEATPRQRFILHRLCGRWLESHGYPRTAAETSIPLGDRIRIEAQIVRGWVSFLSRSASEDHPRLAKLARRWLGIAETAGAGATVWSESKNHPVR